MNVSYSSHNVVRVIKSRGMRWVGHVARMGEERGVYRVLLGKPEGKRQLGRPRRNGYIILGRICGMWVYGLDWAGPGYRQVADACECGNEPSGSVKCGEFLDWLQTS